MANSTPVRSPTMLQGIVMLLYASAVIYIGAEACERYYLKMHKLQPCDNTNILKVKNAVVRISKDCIVDAEGIVELAEKVSRCKLTYDVKKKQIIAPFQGDLDACAEMAKAARRKDVAEKCKKLKIDPKCPLEKQQVTIPVDEKFNISQYRSKFPIAVGRYTGTVQLDCDSGKVCYQFETEFAHGSKPVDSVIQL